MSYTIGETAKILNIAPSALRYYDKEGLLPFVERSKGGMRVFGDENFKWLFIIECLKKSGLSIKDIKSYIDMSLKGDETIPERLNLFLEQRKKVTKQIQELQNTLNILDYKCWFYETAKKHGTTEIVQNMPIEEIPKNLRKVKKDMEKIKK